MDDIKSKILTGDYRIGERIPTESSLQEMYQVSRHTVRKAILELSSEGFYEAKKARAHLSPINIKQNLLDMLI